MAFGRLVEDALRPGAAGEIPRPRIQIVGCGGGGGNSLERLHRLGVPYAQTLAINTDALHLQRIRAHRKLLIGEGLTKGLGAGGLPEIGLKAAELHAAELKEHLGEPDLVFVTVGLGGGTGTGVAPHVANVARGMGALVISIATMPFRHERGREQNARQGVRLLRRHSDTTILLDNNRLLDLVPTLPVEHAFAVMDHLVCEIVRNLSETISVPDLINIDFADLRTVMRIGGHSTILFGEGSSREPEKVVASALKSPMLDVRTKDARGALIHVSSGPSISLGAIDRIISGVTRELREDANVICGARVDRSLEGTARVMCIVTGVPVPGEEAPRDLHGVPLVA